ncbi:MAG TPA: phytoene/squalene synthase family protein [Stellaceae bacterium]|nr:phytoene/squalene synthase family protein [Stellaceae bacterium]
MNATRKSVIEPRIAVESGVARLVRRHDRDRFLSALFAPPERRGELLALYAFNHEVAKTREVVSEPTLGEIRLQWWRDCIDAVYAGNAPRRHEVLEPLAAAIRRRGLTPAHFARLIEARRRDLGDEAPASLAALEDYAEATSAGLVWLALEVLGERGEAAMAAGRATGIAQALIGLLRAVPLHARAKRLYLPRDLTAAARLRVERDLFELRSSAALRAVVREIAAAAARHLATARALRGEAPRAALPALLPAVLAEADLKRLARAGYDPFAARMARPDPWRPWRLTVAALKSRLDGRSAAC